MFSVVIAENELRIANGYPAQQNEFPFLVSLRRNGGHFCGGSLISQKHVLTAAHCIHDYVENPRYHNMRSLRAYVGTNYLNRGGTPYGIKKITYHSSYVHHSKRSNIFMPNDIAILLVGKFIVLIYLLF